MIQGLSSFSFPSTVKDEILYSIFYTSSALREFVAMIKVYNLPHTPISVILGSFLLLTALVSYYGLEGIARISGILFIPILLGILVILLLAVPNYDISYLKPYGGYGLKKTLFNGVLGSSNFIEVSTVWLFLNSLHGIKNAKKAGIIGLLISVAVHCAVVLCYLMVYTYTIAGDNISGLFELSRSIYFNRFFQRVESIFLFIWIITSLIIVSMFLYVTITTYSLTFKIKNHRPLIFPFVFLCFMVAIIPKNISELIQYWINPIRSFSMFLLFVFPAIMLIFCIITGKKGAASGTEKA